MRRFFRPTWAEIDLGALVGNLRHLRKRVGPRMKLMFVVKANAYGHDAVLCALAAQKARAADWLGVSSVEEGLALRTSGVNLPVLVLGSLYPFESVLAAAAHDLTPIVASLESARRVAEAAARLRRVINIHVKVDTGMGRIGVRPDAAPALVRELSALRGIRVQGLYTHMAKAEDDRAFTERQLSAFRKVLKALDKEGLRPPLVHAANSAAALRHPGARFDLVRPGLAAYGLYEGFSPVLTLKSKIIYTKTVGKGTPVSYGAAWRAKRASRIATLPIGYGDGYPRALSNKASVLVGGKRCPVVGRVTMDQVMIDVTDVPRARVGDDAVLIGSQDGASIPAAELARACGTISYETVTALSGRVPRVGVGA
ncbi:MAG: alanine racemase [Elusimicrobia bacterium]|nr:alanine racemase [Elusimicrobiota bacterium]